MLTEGYVRFGYSSHFSKYSSYLNYTEKAHCQRGGNDSKSKMPCNIVLGDSKEVLQRPFDKVFIELWSRSGRRNFAAIIS